MSGAILSDAATLTRQVVRGGRRDGPLGSCWSHSIRIAQSNIASFPADVYCAVNASPGTVVSDEFLEVMGGMPAERMVLEITEHAHVEDYDLLLRAMEPLRLRGMRLAVDDAGAGYSSLQHILQLRPDLIKLDMGLTRSIDSDPARRAMA